MHLVRVCVIKHWCTNRLPLPHPQPHRLPTPASITDLPSPPYAHSTRHLPVPSTSCSCPLEPTPSSNDPGITCTKSSIRHSPGLCAGSSSGISRPSRHRHHSARSIQQRQSVRFDAGCAWPNLRGLNSLPGCCGRRRERQGGW